MEENLTLPEFPQYDPLEPVERRRVSLRNFRMSSTMDNSRDYLICNFGNIIHSVVLLGCWILIFSFLLTLGIITTLDAPIDYREQVVIASVCLQLLLCFMEFILRIYTLSRIGVYNLFAVTTLYLLRILQITTIIINSVLFIVDYIVNAQHFKSSNPCLKSIQMVQLLFASLSFLIFTIYIVIYKCCITMYTSYNNNHNNNHDQNDNNNTKLLEIELAQPGDILYNTDTCIICMENLTSTSTAELEIHIDTLNQNNINNIGKEKLLQPDLNHTIYLKCGHNFHQFCITRWIFGPPQVHKTCPICHKDCIKL